jgi:hypothetical protein
LFDQVQAGVLSPQALGLSESDFFLFLQQAAEYLESFGKELDKATRSTVNLPRAINLAALEFKAQAAGGRSIRWEEAWGTFPGRGSTLPPGGGGPSTMPGAGAGAGRGLTDDSVSRLVAALESGTLATNLGRFAESLAALGAGDSDEGARKLEAMLDRMSVRRSGQSGGVWGRD